MKNDIARFWALVTLAFLLVPGMSLSGQTQYSSSPTDTLSYWQAGSAIFNANKYLTVVHWGKMTAQLYSLNAGSIKVTAASLEFDVVNKKGGTKHLQVNVKDLTTVSATCGGQSCGLIPAVAVQDMEGVQYFLWFGWSTDGKPCQLAENDAECMHAADWFAAALNSLHAFAISHPAGLDDFHKQAAAWRALATKLPIPEKVNVQRLMAEDAIKENKPYEALNYYELGIQLYPTWPEGNFNAALIAAELKYYADAIEHMQAYLELIPDASDAQAAREKIMIWQVKAKQ